MGWELTAALWLVPVGIVVLALLLLTWRRTSLSPNVAQRLLAILAAATAAWLIWFFLWAIYR
jgi:hypothetical protein